MNERVALVFEEREYGLTELRSMADGMAGTLVRRGVRPGDRVALMSSNRPEFVVAVQAVWRAGAAVVLFSPAWKRTEAEHALAITRPSHAVGDHPVLAELMPMLHLDDPVESGPAPSVEHDPAVRRACWCSARARPGCPRRCATRTRSIGRGRGHWCEALGLAPTTGSRSPPRRRTSSACSTCSPRCEPAPRCGCTAGSTSTRCCAASRPTG